MQLTMLRTTPTTTRSLAVALLTTGSLAAILLGGCKDPKVEQTAKFEAEFNAVAASYASTVASNTNLLSVQPTADSLNALRAIAEQAKGLSGGTAQQQEAATQLTTSIYRTAGGLELAHALRLESNEELQRTFVINASQLAGSLEAIADASEALDFTAARRGPQAAKDAAARAARTVQESVRSIERPLEQLVASISSDAARIDQLELESALLLRKARESSPAAGQAFVEESAAIQAQARSKRTDVANNELAATELDSQLALENASLSAAEGIQAAATNALDFVSKYESDIDGAAAKSRALATQLKNEANVLLKTISEERASVLNAAYEAATADFALAADGIGSDAAGAALGNTLMCEELRAKNAQVQGLGAQGRMLAMLGSDSAAELAQVKTAASAAITALKERCASANDSIAAFGEDPAYEALKTYVMAMKKSADALNVDTLLTPPTPIVAVAKPATKPAANSGRTRPASTDGIDDPEAFVAKLATLDLKAAGVAFVGAIDNSTAAGKALKTVIGQTFDAMQPVMDAVTEKFGAVGVAALGCSGSGSGMGMMDPSSIMKLTKESNDGSRAVFKAPDGSNIVFLKGASGWTIDMTEMMRAQGMGDEQIEQMAPMMSMVMGPMMNAMKAAAGEVAAKVRSGEITSAADAATALQAAMTQAMAGAMGGAMRGR